MTLVEDDRPSPLSHLEMPTDSDRENSAAPMGIARSVASASPSAFFKASCEFAALPQPAIENASSELSAMAYQRPHKPDLLEAVP
ncbi:hypothetical protein AB0I53_39200 [Saccharopolyspora sp. NPDC050389]|uniref:hypothetical protein n=1 Tax=Saccharopolyspora sp. NPDC050389 TaxID=3155516 RepID=UPI0033C861E5